MSQFLKFYSYFFRILIGIPSVVLLVALPPAGSADSRSEPSICASLCKFQGGKYERITNEAAALNDGRPGDAQRAVLVAAGVKDDAAL